MSEQLPWMLPGVHPWPFHAAKSYQQAVSVKPALSDAAVPDVPSARAPLSNRNLSRRLEEIESDSEDEISSAPSISRNPAAILPPSPSVSVTSPAASSSPSGQSTIAPLETMNLPLMLPDLNDSMVSPGSFRAALGSPSPASSKQPSLSPLSDALSSAQQSPVPVYSLQQQRSQAVALSPMLGHPPSGYPVRFQIPGLKRDAVFSHTASSGPVLPPLLRSPAAAAMTRSSSRALTNASGSYATATFAGLNMMDLSTTESSPASQLSMSPASTSSLTPSHSSHYSQSFNHSNNSNSNGHTPQPMPTPNRVFSRSHRLSVYEIHERAEVPGSPMPSPARLQPIGTPYQSHSHGTATPNGNNGNGSSSSNGLPSAGLSCFSPSSFLGSPQRSHGSQDSENREEGQSQPDEPPFLPSPAPVRNRPALAAPASVTHSVFSAPSPVSNGTAAPPTDLGRSTVAPAPSAAPVSVPCCEWCGLALRRPDTGFCRTDCERWADTLRNNPRP